MGLLGLTLVRFGVLFVLVGFALLVVAFFLAASCNIKCNAAQQ